MQNDSLRVDKAYKTNSCSTTYRTFTTFLDKCPYYITLNMSRLRAATIVGCFVVALMNPRIGTVFKTLFDWQSGVVGAQILRVGLRVERTGPNHHAASHGLDRYIQRWKSSAAPRFDGIQIEKDG
jgi:hypothetical protein